MVDRKEVKYGKIDQMDRKEVETRLRNLMEQNKIGNVEKDVTPEPEVIAHDGVEHKGKELDMNDLKLWKEDENGDDDNQV
jgi:hypothetical protein